MKKYIRTKHSVHEWKKLYCTTRRYYEDYPEEIIKQSNSIDKLCDEYVLVQKDGSKDIFIATDDGNWLQHRGDSYYSFGLKQIRDGREDISGLTLYGAIWATGEHGEPVLKPVAKVNEKGELELL